jgi:hypothetical protein
MGTFEQYPWLLVPLFSSSPKLGTALGGLGAYMHFFDAASRVSLFGATYKYTSTHSQIFSAFARTSSGADHHRVVLIGAFGHIKNDYEDYLGTGQPLKTDDDLKAIFTYLRTIKPVHHRVDNNEPVAYCRICKRKHHGGALN